MKILSHRGFHLDVEERNSGVAFARSRAAGFGVETDVRDASGQLVIAHDPATSRAMPFQQFLGLFADSQLPLALNIKADGLAPMVREAMYGYGGVWFVFDMSAPETLRCLASNLPVFVRQSDIEPHPICYERAAGIWLDAFTSDWFGANDVVRHLDCGKSVAIVSPELHGRDHEALWTRLRKAGLGERPDVFLCTDFPQRARDCFAGSKSPASPAFAVASGSLRACAASPGETAPARAIRVANNATILEFDLLQGNAQISATDVIESQDGCMRALRTCVNFGPRSYPERPASRWQDCLPDAETDAADEQWSRVVASLNSIHVASLPRGSYGLCSRLARLIFMLPEAHDGWWIDHLAPTLLKWGINQAPDDGVPYLLRYIVGLGSEARDPARLEAFVDATDRALRTLSDGGERTTAELCCLCLSTNPQRKEQISRDLATRFRELTREQCNIVFCSWNTVAIDWARKHAIGQLGPEMPDVALFNLLTVLLVYGSEDDAQKIIDAAAGKRFVDERAKRFFARLMQGRKKDPQRAVSAHAVAGGKKLRIAVCVSGQLRGFRDAFSSWELLGLGRHSTDYYVHVWEKVGRKLPVPFHTNRPFSEPFASCYATHAHRLGNDQFWKKYPSLYGLFEGGSTITRGQLTSFYNTDSLVIESEEDHPELQSNADRMHYKIEECSKLMERANKHYDVVVRIRPDKEIVGNSPNNWHQLARECLVHRVIYVDSVRFLFGYAIGDQLAFGCHEDMRLYASAWSLLCSNRAQSRDDKVYGLYPIALPHHTLAMTTLHHGIFVRDMNTLLARPGPLRDDDPVTMTAVLAALQKDVGTRRDRMDRDLLAAAEICARHDNTTASGGTRERR